MARLQRSVGEELTPGRGRSVTGAFLQLVPQFGHLGAARSKKEHLLVNERMVKYVAGSCDRWCTDLSQVLGAAP